MPTSQPLISLILKAVALAMAVVVIVLNTLGAANVETSVLLLAIGLFALALQTLRGA